MKIPDRLPSINLFLMIWNKIFSFLITLFKISQLLHPTRRHIVENVEFWFWIWPNEAWLLSLYRRWITDSLRITDTETIKFLDLGFYNRSDHPVKIMFTNLLRLRKSFWSNQNCNNTSSNRSLGSWIGSHERICNGKFDWIWYKVRGFPENVLQVRIIMRNWQPDLDTDSDIGFFETSCANMNSDLESVRYSRQNPVYYMVYNIHHIIYCILYGLRIKKSISELSIPHLNRKIFREALMVRRLWLSNSSP